MVHGRIAVNYFRFTGTECEGVNNRGGILIIFNISECFKNNYLFFVDIIINKSPPTTKNVVSFPYDLYCQNQFLIINNLAAQTLDIL